MHKWIKSTVIALTLGTVLVFRFGVSSGEAPTPSLDTISQEIQTHFEDHWLELRPQIQAHYATRLYRITGDEQYTSPLFMLQLSRSSQLLQDWEKRNDKDYATERSRALLAYFKEHKISERTQLRADLFKQYPEVPFQLNLLAQLYQIYDLGLLESTPFNTIKKNDITEYFKTTQLSEFVLDKEVIELYASRLSDYVMQLKVFGVIDLEDKYMESFKQVFFEKPDEQLSPLQFESKLYGMTHMIIAASRYYQKKVSDKKYEWIEEYFSKQPDFLVNKVKADIAMEIALVFLLRDYSTSHAAVETVKKYIQANFSAEHNMILGVDGNAEINAGEHRNVLALMVLNWPNQLHAGPNLSKNSDYQRFKITPGFDI